MLNAETDYETLNKLKKLEEDNKRLEESVRVFENAMNTYKKEAENYQAFKNNMEKTMTYDEIKYLNEMLVLYTSINKFIKTELSPVQYEYCLNFVGNNKHITDSFINMINTVEDWCLDMKTILNKNTPSSTGNR